MNPTYYYQPPGDGGTYRTLQIMAQLARQAAVDPSIRDRAAQLISGCGRDYRCQDFALMGWVSSRMRYVNDPEHVETINHPVTWTERRIRQNGFVYGDCDDMSTYLASLLKAVGHNPTLTAIARFKDQPFHHVYIVCHGNDLDATGQYRKGAKISRIMKVEV